MSSFQGLNHIYIYIRQSVYNIWLCTMAEDRESCMQVVPCSGMCPYDIEGYGVSTIQGLDYI